MLGSIDVVQHFQRLLKAINAKRVIEVGTFTGYTTLSLALALPDDGQVFTFDINDKEVAYNVWKDAGVSQKIKLFKGPAVESLQKLLDEGQANTFDFAFIDADKTNYINYYELCLKLVRPKGIIAVDNVLWSGRCADETYQDESTLALRAINDLIRDDDRVDISMLAVGDGVTICLKK